MTMRPGAALSAAFSAQYRQSRKNTAPTAADYTRAQAAAIRAGKVNYECGQPAAALIIGGAIAAIAGTTALLIQGARWVMHY